MNPSYFSLTKNFGGSNLSLLSVARDWTNHKTDYGLRQPKSDSSRGWLWRPASGRWWRLQIGGRERRRQRRGSMKQRGDSGDTTIIPALSAYQPVCNFWRGCQPGWVVYTRYDFKTSILHISMWFYLVQEMAIAHFCRRIAPPLNITTRAYHLFLPHLTDGFSIFLNDPPSLSKPPCF